MERVPVASEPMHPWLAGYRRVLTLVVHGLNGVALASIVAMMLVTTVDVILRLLRHPLPGAFDLVKYLGAIALACGLPYTTAVKGHVAVEFFFQRLSRRHRTIVDAIERLVVISLFSTLAWQSTRYGWELRRSGEVCMTLKFLPVYPLAYAVALACAVIVLITVYHALRPGRPMIKP